MASGQDYLKQPSFQRAIPADLVPMLILEWLGSHIEEEVVDEVPEIVMTLHRPQSIFPALQRQQILFGEAVFEQSTPLARLSPGWFGPTPS